MATKRCSARRTSGAAGRGSSLDIRDVRASTGLTNRNRLAQYDLPPDGDGGLTDENDGIFDCAD